MSGRLAFHTFDLALGDSVAGVLTELHVELHQLVEARRVFHGSMVRADNGGEFAGKAMEAWAYQDDVKLDLIRPGKPVENGYSKASTDGCAMNA